MFKLDKGLYMYLKKRGNVNSQLLEAFPEAKDVIVETIPDNQLSIDWMTQEVPDQLAKLEAINRTLKKQKFPRKPQK